MGNLHKLEKCFEKSLGINDNEISDDYSFGSVGWDSVAHMALVASIEIEFDIMLDTEDVIGMSSFGVAKKIIKEVVNIFDHKFFINRKYLKNEDESHYVISFEGPKGMFELQVPKDTTYLLEGEATVENLSSEIIKLLAPKMPSNVEALGVYIYEGYNKGSHIISNISR